MNILLKTAALIILLYFSALAGTCAQNLKLDEMNSCFAASNYPTCLYDLIESKGFYRIDKQYLERCDRVVYAYVKADKPAMFVNPVLCPKPQTSSIYPKYVKNELELQFQKNGRMLFETMSAQIKKTCKPLADENGSLPDPKSKTAKRVYRNETSGIIYVVINTAPVAYIYLLK